jgi:hypothetical protein
MFIPFELQVSGKLNNLNLRAEKHGDENAGAADLSIEITESNDILWRFDPALKSLLYTKDLSQPDLLSDADPSHLTRLRFPHLGPLLWDREITTCDCEIAYGLGAITLKDCTLSKWRITPDEGGSVTVVFRVQAHPAPDDVGKLYGLIQSEIDLDIVQRAPAPGKPIDEEDDE